MSTEDSNDEIINAHISFLYNNLSSCKMTREDFADFRDDVEVQDNNRLTSVSSHYPNSAVYGPLKKMFNGLKKRVKKKKNCDDVEPLMPKNLLLKSLKWEVMEAEKNINYNESEGLRDD